MSPSQARSKSISQEFVEVSTSAQSGQLSGGYTMLHLVLVRKKRDGAKREATRPFPKKSMTHSSVFPTPWVPPTIDFGRLAEWKMPSWRLVHRLLKVFFFLHWKRMEKVGKKQLLGTKKSGQA